MKNNQTMFLKLCLADALLQLMNEQDYESVNVNRICEKAGVGRTTFYRHFGNKNSKQELLRFKIIYEWETYQKKHSEEFRKDRTFTFLNYVYENQKTFTLLYESGVLSELLCLTDALNAEDYADDKRSSYLKAFMSYGSLGVIRQWIAYGFDEPPLTLARHIGETLAEKFINADGVL